MFLINHHVLEVHKKHPKINTLGIIFLTVDNVLIVLRTGK